MRMETVLLSYWRSSCSYRVRIALNWKRVEYQYQAVNLLKGEQSAEEYKEQENAMGVVPTLHIDGAVLTESVAIIEYLEETRPEHPLLPESPVDRATVRALCSMIGSGIQPIQNLWVLKKVAEFEEEHKMPWGKFVIERGFQALEKVLSRTSGTYCCGSQVTMADLFLVPQVFNAARFGVDVTSFPNIHRIYEALSELPEFQQAHPDQQPDAVPV